MTLTFSRKTKHFLMVFKYLKLTLNHSKSLSFLNSSFSTIFLPLRIQQKNRKNPKDKRFLAVNL